MKKYILIILLFIIHSILFAQTAKQVFSIEQYKTGEYYYGEGIDKDLSKAKRIALNDLSSKFSVIVKSNTISMYQENNDNINYNSSQNITTITRTVLKNIDYNGYQDSIGYHQVAYISKFDYNNYYKNKYKEINDFISTGNSALNDNNIGTSLMYYYYSLVLLNSFPNKEQFDSLNYRSSLSNKIQTILNNIAINLINTDTIQDGNEIDLTFQMLYNNKEINNLDLKYYDGQSMNIIEGKNGQLVIQLIGSSTLLSDIQFNIIYDYEDNKDNIPSISEIWDYNDRPKFKNFYDVELKQVPKVNQIADNLFQDQINIFYKALQGSYKYNDLFLTNKIESFKKYNDPKIVKYNQNKVIINKTKFGYEIRGIPINCYYKSLHKTSCEQFVFDFNENKQLIDFNLSVANGKCNDQNKLEVIKFIEKYRMAYQCRDTSTLNKIFSNKAIIISGRYLNINNNFNSDLLNKKSQYTKLDKQQFMQRQIAIFKKQKDIFIKLSNFDNESNSNGILSMSMRQLYNSTTYSDNGFLFFIIDFRQKNPQILLREWRQNEFDSAKLPTLDDYNIEY